MAFYNDMVDRYDNFRKNNLDNKSTTKAQLKAFQRDNMLLHEQGKPDWMARRFNRLQYPNIYNGISNTIEYVFFTKPDLNILKTKGKVQSSKLNEKDAYKIKVGDLNEAFHTSAYWNDMYNRYIRIICQLQQSAPTSIAGEYLPKKSVFMPILTNMLSSNVDIPSSTADVTETASTIYGSKIQYRKGSMPSDEGIDFSLDFIDFPNLEVYHLFKMWDTYETAKDIGLVGPPEAYNPPPETNILKKFIFKSYGRNTGYYRINQILHDQIAIYKFVIDGDDMETILHYSKFTGCFPKSVPRDAFSNFKGDGVISYSVDWHAQFYEDMNIDILHEFNELCRFHFGNKSPTNNSAYKYIPPFNQSTGRPNGTFVDFPYIEVLPDYKNYTNPGNPGNNYKYKPVLRWYNKA